MNDRQDFRAAPERAEGVRRRTTAAVQAVAVEGSVVTLSLRFPPGEGPGPTTPGQFVLVKAPGVVWRPFFLSDVGDDTGALSFRAGGGATRWLADRRPGDELECLGPLGRGFPIERGSLALVAAGTHAAVWLDVVRRRGGDGVWAALGSEEAGQRAWHAALAGRLRQMGAEAVATEAAALPELLERRLGRLPAERVLAVAPRPLLRAVRAVAARHGAELWVAWEERMACGVGACWGCVAPARPQAGVGPYLRTCAEGPVLPADWLDWDRV